MHVLRTSPSPKQQGNPPFTTAWMSLQDVKVVGGIRQTRGGQALQDHRRRPAWATRDSSTAVTREGQSQGAECQTRRGSESHGRCA